MARRAGAILAVTMGRAVPSRSVLGRDSASARRGDLHDPAVTPTLRAQPGNSLSLARAGGHPVRQSSPESRWRSGRFPSPRTSPVVEVDHTRGASTARLQQGGGVRFLTEPYEAARVRLRLLPASTPTANLVELDNQHEGRSSWRVGDRARVGERPRSHHPAPTDAILEVRAGPRICGAICFPSTHTPAPSEGRNRGLGHEFAGVVPSRWAPRWGTCLPNRQRRRQHEHDLRRHPSPLPTGGGESRSARERSSVRYRAV